MSRLVPFCLASVLSIVGGGSLAHAYDYRVDPNAVRRAEFSFALTPQSLHAAAADKIDAVAKGLPREYASAMTWYRVALADGYALPPMVASPWTRDEQLPDPLHWTWVADNGDLVTRADRGVFQLSFADNQSNWFREIDCRLISWPGGDTEAPMICDDGQQRTMRIPGDGVVLVDDVQYTRVFDSDETTLPPEEVVSVDQLTAAAIQDAGIIPQEKAKPAASRATAVVLPEKAPIPQFR